jgi:hypothetical protein
MLVGWLWLVGCGDHGPQPVGPPSKDYVGTWRSQDETIRLVLTSEGQFQETKGKWTNTGIVVAWTNEGFKASAYPEPELHKVREKPHDKAGYTWMTVDDAELWRVSSEAKIGAPMPVPPADQPAPTAAPLPSDAPAPGSPEAPPPATPSAP